MHRLDRSKAARIRFARAWAQVIAMLAVAMLAVACGPTMTTDEATAACERQRAADTACINDAAFDACVACHEECGRECLILESCPVQFQCD